MVPLLGLTYRFHITGIGGNRWATSGGDLQTSTGYTTTNTGYGDSEEEEEEEQGYSGGEEEEEGSEGSDDENEMVVLDPDHVSNACFRARGQILVFGLTRWAGLPGAGCGISGQNLRIRYIGTHL